jgi:hypothetical protein
VAAANEGKWGLHFEVRRRRGIGEKNSEAQQYQNVGEVLKCSKLSGRA